MEIAIVTEGTQDDKNLASARKQVIWELQQAGFSEQQIDDYQQTREYRNRIQAGIAERQRTREQMLAFMEQGRISKC